MNRIALVWTLLTCGIAAAQAGTSLQQLKEECEAAREQRLAPERQALIDECIASKEKSPDACRRYYQDYGAGGRTAAGGHRQRLYHDIPECQELYQAEQNGKQR